ncbi:MAG: PAS domain S-box protein [candidate division Zixibacteria bacterium]|nr:PAS domain S-box protein [candidate division Zixibacteria bacterium]
MITRVTIFWKLIVAFIILFLVELLILQAFNAAGLSPLLSNILAITVMLLIGCFTAAYFIRLYIKPPIEQLHKGMNMLAERKYNFRLEEDKKDEFGSLASSFNEMADMLTSSLTELKRNRDYLESIFEGSADIIITVNDAGNIRTINTGAENTLGYNQMEIAGKPIDILFADPEEKDIAIQKLRLSENVVNYEMRFITKQKEERNVLFTLTRLHNSNGAVIGTIGIGKDITEEKRLQKKLIQSQRLAAIGEVFTGIQHSMKNMLNACKGGSYMVRTGLKNENHKMLIEGWAMVEEGIFRMTAMSMDMLKYVKEWKPRVKLVDIQKLLIDIDGVIGKTARDKSVELKLDVSSDIPTVLCDSQMIHSAVMDIVSNAIDACLWKDYDKDEIPEVKLSTYLSEDNEKSIIEVVDNGCGMSERVIENIFTPFFSTKSKAGTGLGLSITSRMIDVHGGNIEVESETDVGTTFRIVLPVNATGRNKENDHGKKSISS